MTTAHYIESLREVQISDISCLFPSRQQNIWSHLFRVHPAVSLTSYFLSPRIWRESSVNVCESFAVVGMSSYPGVVGFLSHIRYPLPTRQNETEICQSLSMLPLFLKNDSMQFMSSLSPSKRTLQPHSALVRRKENEGQISLLPLSPKVSWLRKTKVFGRESWREIEGKGGHGLKKDKERKGKENDVWAFTHGDCKEKREMNDWKMNEWIKLTEKYMSVRQTVSERDRIVSHSQSYRDTMMCDKK